MPPSHESACYATSIIFPSFTVTRGQLSAAFRRIQAIKVMDIAAASPDRLGSAQHTDDPGRRLARMLAMLVELMRR